MKPTKRPYRPRPLVSLGKAAQTRQPHLAATKKKQMRKPQKTKNADLERLGKLVSDISKANATEMRNAIFARA